MKFILSPSENLYYLSEKPIKILQKIEGYTSNGDSLAVFNHKKITIYDISKIQEVTSQEQQIPKVNEADFSKKVEAVSIIGNHNAIVSDKYGDIFLIKQGQQKQFLNQNFSIPTLLHYVDLGQQDRMFIVGDQYSKTKVFNFNNPHQIFSIWTPFEATLLQIIRDDQTLVYLVRVDKKDTVECKYKLYTLNVKDLKNQHFPGVEIEALSSQFSDEHYCKIIVHESHVYAVSLQINKLHIQKIALKEKFVKQKQLISNIESHNWNYIDIAYHNQLYIFIGNEKIQTSEQQGQQILKSLSDFNVVHSSPNEYLLSIKI